MFQRLLLLLSSEICVILICRYVNSQFKYRRMCVDERNTYPIVGSIEQKSLPLAVILINFSILIDNRGILAGLLSDSSAFSVNGQ